jgi:hypothetical protein
VNSTIEHPVVFIRMLTGEEIVAKLIVDTPMQLVVEKPLQLIPAGPDGNMRYVPWLMAAGNNFPISPTAVMVISHTPHEGLKSEYLRATSGVITPQKPTLVI